MGSQPVRYWIIQVRADRQSTTTGYASPDMGHETIAFRTARGTSFFGKPLTHTSNFLLIALVTMLTYTIDVIFPFIDMLKHRYTGIFTTANTKFCTLLGYERGVGANSCQSLNLG